MTKHQALVARRVFPIPSVTRETYLAPCTLARSYNWKISGRDAYLSPVESRVSWNIEVHAQTRNVRVT